jgi:hypothetical protein
MPFEQESPSKDQENPRISSAFSSRKGEAFQ